MHNNVPDVRLLNLIREHGITFLLTCRYPGKIPDGTAVPHYAYQSLFTNGTFDFASAVLDKGVEATHIASTSGSTSRSTSISSYSTRTEASESSSSGSSSNTGAIAGGVVGCFVGLAIIAALIFFLVRRHRRRGLAGVATTGPMGGDIPLTTSSFVGKNLTGLAYAPPVYNKVYVSYVLRFCYRAHTV